MYKPSKTLITTYIDVQKSDQFNPINIKVENKPILKPYKICESVREPHFNMLIKGQSDNKETKTKST